MDIVVLLHGTTRQRAERLLTGPPNPRFREPGELPSRHTIGFSTTREGEADRGLSSSTEYAKRKAKTFPNEGGPAILRVAVPRWIIELVENHGALGPVASSGEVSFYDDCGLPELAQLWSQFEKQVIEL